MLEFIDKPSDIAAWERFTKIGLPTKKTETYKYVRLKELYQRPFCLPKAAVASFSEHALVFVNGVYNPTCSTVPQTMIALPLSEAYKTYGAFLSSRLNKQLNEEKDPFAVLNQAYFTEGLFIYLPAGTLFKEPIHILNIVTDVSDATLVCPRLHCFAGKGAAASFYFSQNIIFDHTWVNTYIDFALEENAQIKLCAIHSQNASTHDFLSLRATLKQHSLLQTLAVTHGAATSRHDYGIRLLGEHANASLYGVWSLKGQRQHHVNVFMDHQEPNCTSLQKFKGICADRARSSFEGKIYVHPQAQKTQAYQMNNNLVLSPRASCNSKPNLEIFADDVKASHGATIGQLNEEHLFYLKTRGVLLEEAHKLLLNGFTKEMIDLIIDAQMKENALQVLQ